MQQERATEIRTKPPRAREHSLDLSVVVPVYNNAATLTELAERLNAAVSGKVSAFELVLVDDGSKDNSWGVINELARTHAFVRGVRLSRNFGQHPAIAAGFKAARGNVIVLMDADLEDRPESVPLLLDALKAPIDIVYTVAVGAEGRPRWTSSLFHKAFSLAVRAEVPRDIGTLRAFTRKVRDAVLAYNEYNVLYGPLMFFLGFDCAFVTVSRQTQAGRVSSYNFMKRLRLAQASLISYTNLPSTVLLGAGVALFGLIVLYASVIAFQYLFSPVHAPPGLVLLALLVLGGLAVNLVAFGVLGTYVFRVYQEVLGRPRFHVRDTTFSGPAAATTDKTWLGNERRQIEGMDV